MQELREVGNMPNPGEKQIIIGAEQVSAEQFNELREKAPGHFKLEKVAETSESVEYKKKALLKG